MIRTIAFASCYAYSPSGSSETSVRSRLLRSLLKSADPHFLFKYAGRVRQQVMDGQALDGFLLPDDVLVPVPGFAPGFRDCKSVSERLVEAMIEAGVATTMWRGLHRMHAVRKSATSNPGDRPSVDSHYRSFGIGDDDPPPGPIVLVDDVVTKGRTLLAAAARLHDDFPDTPIRAFALLRTVGFCADVDCLLRPCIGKIRWRAGDARRTP